MSSVYELSRRFSDLAVKCAAQADAVPPEVRSNLEYAVQACLNAKSSLQAAHRFIQNQKGAA